MCIQILVCEDGLQLFDEKEVLKRRGYYERMNCEFPFLSWSSATAEGVGKSKVHGLLVILRIGLVALKSRPI